MPYQTKVPPEIQELADQVGKFIHYWGFKQVHGRIWTHLYLSSEPLDAADLMERLDISKALVSISVADLLEYDVILEAGKSQDSTQLYRANPDLMTVIMRVLREREKKMLAQAATAVKQVSELSESEKAHWKVCPQNLNTLGDFILAGQAVLESIIGLKNLKFDDFSFFTKSHINQKGSTP